jgi:hypothetical protein
LRGSVATASASPSCRRYWPPPSSPSILSTRKR